MASESRAQARERINGEILDAGRRQLADVGAAGLSLREVAREIGMVSSAVYRYVESRDELLTRLIVAAYDELGKTAEEASTAAAAEAPDQDLDRWLAVASAIRRWSLDNPHEYLLLYGSPVPGYVAPPTATVGPGTRATFALVGVVADADAAGRLQPPSGPDAALSPELIDELNALAAPGSAPRVVATLTAWTQMFGYIGFELTNQLRGVVHDKAALFEAMTYRLGYQIGLR